MAHIRQPCLPCTSYGSNTPTVELSRRSLVSIRPQGRRLSQALWLNAAATRSSLLHRCRGKALPPEAGDGAAISPSSSADVFNPTGSVDSVEDPQPAPSKTPVQKAREFANRVIFGLLLGLAGAVVILYGKLAMLALLVFASYQASREYFGFITSKQMSKGMPPPTPLVSTATTVMCMGMTLFSHFYRGKSGTLLAVASFLLLVIQVLANKRPKFSQLASSLFGLFYCGWLPSFWLKLRSLGSQAPDTPLVTFLHNVTGWPITTGAVAVLTASAVIIAADTGAYFVGKALGRTKLTDISPKKTVEGAAGGMAAAVSVAMGCWAVFAWPATPLAAGVLGVMVFFSSLFGDLIESIMKRDAGMKDSGDLIPGHGGLLDRFDSYIFSGAVVYFFSYFCVPLLSTLTGPQAAAAVAAAAANALARL
ncbi:hypothetical protein Agub_g8062 [Astrephomene gubernaculifera]|uniref:Phosphatidate cytidylyltransferase n=1 Tax=Astrephomene gubernaculifera TaxID=47775 RepID=A0AAD3DR17_9CHLO|nr:hypothetical protein Agub_g8062 [Astrephomene gubernaculifera]